MDYYLCECSRLWRERDLERDRCRRRLSRSLERERERRFSRDAERERRRLRSRSRSRERDLETVKGKTDMNSCYMHEIREMSSATIKAFSHLQL